MKASINTSGGSGYAAYGGKSIIGDFLGLFESVFTTLFMALSVELIVAPLYLAYVQDAQLGSSVSISQDLTNMWVSIIASLGSFFGQYAINEGISQTIGFFNDFNPDAPDGNNDTLVFVYDVGNHSIISLLYLILAASVSNGFFGLAYQMLLA